MMKRHRGAKFGTATALSEEGWRWSTRSAADRRGGPASARDRNGGKHHGREQPKVGIISCSGEEIPGGTISRLATRRVLELCGRSRPSPCACRCSWPARAERRFAREHPTITVDGCDKLCAKRGTEQYSGQVAASLVVSDILGDRLAGCHRSQRDLDKADEEAVWIVAERIAAEVDELLAAAPQRRPEVEASNGSGACSCAAACRGPA